MIISTSIYKIFVSVSREWSHRFIVQCFHTHWCDHTIKTENAAALMCARASQGWIQEGGGGGGGGPNPENQFENGVKFLCLKGKGRTISLFLHQKCFNVNSSGQKEPQSCNCNCNFQPPHELELHEAHVPRANISVK